MEIELYTAKGSNCSHRVEWALNYKKIPYRRIEVFDNKPVPDYQTINVLSQVPALSVNNYLISESMAILEYLEELYPDIVPLLGHTLNERAHVRRICEFVNTGIHAPQNNTALQFFRPDLTEPEKSELRGKWILSRLNVISNLMCHQSVFAVGQSFSLADIFVASIYKKALQFGAPEHAFFHTHLHDLRRNESIANAEPLK